MPNDNQTTSESPSCDAACSPRLFDIPETAKFVKTVRGTPLDKYWAAVGQMEKMERERFTIEEIADYIAGWTLGSFDEVQKLGAHVAHNALNQLRDEQDGIQAVRIRKLYRKICSRSGRATTIKR